MIWMMEVRPKRNQNEGLIRFEQLTGWPNASKPLETLADALACTEAWNKYNEYWEYTLVIPESATRPMQQKLFNPRRENVWTDA